MDHGPSVAGSELLREAEAFDGGLPHQRVAALASSAVFVPDWLDGAAPFSGLAFAMYDFVIEDYSGAATLRFSWVAPSPLPADVYIGLANWDKNKWDWRQGEADNNLDLSSLSPYLLPSGGLLVCVVKVGTASSELDWLRIGGDPPQASLKISPASGVYPLNVNFDASASTDPDGSIVKYEWDPEGDGSFDVTTNGNPLFNYEYGAAGNFQAAVRVTDETGIFADAAVTVNALDSLVFTYGTPESSESACSMIVNAQNELLIFGERKDSILLPSHVFVAKVRQDLGSGSGKTWGGSSNDILRKAVAGSDGFVYACGLTSSYGEGATNGLLQKWTQDGELVWSRTIGTTDDSVEFNALQIHSGSIYICGSYYLTAISHYLALVCRLDMDGNIIWAKSVIAPIHSIFNDLAIFDPPPPELPALRLCGRYDPNAFGRDALYAEYDTDGNQLDCQILGSDPLLEEAYSICIGGALGNDTSLTGVSYNGSTGENHAFVSRPGGSSIELSVDDSPGYAVPAALFCAGDGADTMTLALTSVDLTGNNIILSCALGTDLNLLSWDALVAGELGICYPAGLSFYGTPHVGLTGKSGGPLPVPVNSGVSQLGFGLTWETIFPSQGSPSQLVVADTPISVTELTDCSFNNPENGEEALVWITP